MSLKSLCVLHSSLICRRVLPMRSASSSLKWQLMLRNQARKLSSQATASAIISHGSARQVLTDSKRPNGVFPSRAGGMPTCLLPGAEPLCSVPVRRYSSKNELPELSFEDLQALMQDDDIKLFDVREPKELEEYGSIPNAVNIPLGQVKEALSLSDEEFERQYKCCKPQTYDANVVFYGLGPIKSRAALELARKLGYNKARHYGGGWEEYSRKTGQPLKK